jgi:hypothetical protein
MSHLLAMYRRVHTTKSRSRVYRNMGPAQSNASITTAATIAKTMMKNRPQPLRRSTTLVTTCGGGVVCGAIGRPQCGHAGAWSETSCPQSSHLISATTPPPRGHCVSENPALCNSARCVYNHWSAYSPLRVLRWAYRYGAEPFGATLGMGARRMPPGGQRAAQGAVLSPQTWPRPPLASRAGAGRCGTPLST